MHSALPQVDGHFHAKKKNQRPNVVQAFENFMSNFQEGQRPYVYGALALTALVFIALIGSIGALFSRSSHPYVIHDGSTVQTVVKSPYIYPDLARYSEYKLMQSVTLDTGKKVNSAKHSYKYSGSETPEVILVSGFISDAGYTAEYLQRVLDNRLEFAKTHGHGLYIRYMKDFQGSKVVGNNDGFRFQRAEFAKLYLIREAMYAFPDAKWIWWLDQDAIIKNPDYDIKGELLTPAELEKKIERDVPILPPESVIHTYKRVSGSNIRLIVSQNDRGISTQSFFVSNDDMYGHVLMEYWMDPLHRNYHGFIEDSVNQYSGLEASITHMVQWHPAILSKLAIVSHKYLGSYLKETALIKGQDDPPYNVLLLRSPDEHGFPGFDTINQSWLNNILGAEKSKA